MELIENKRLLRTVIDATEIKIIVSIDDAYAERFNVEQVLTLYKLIVDREVVRSLLADIPNLTIGDPDITDADIRREWEGLPRETQRQIIWNLKNHTHDGDENDLLDYRALLKLRELLDEVVFVPLSLQEWQKADFAALASKGKVLMLVDQDMRKDGGGPEHGIQIIRGLLNDEGNKGVVCALLTHKVTGNIHEASDEMAKQYHLNKSQFLIIPKVVLDNEPLEFARLVKLSAINEVSEALKRRALAIVKDALGGAESDLEEININDLDEMVFRSSYEEGVWEPETLFRIFGIFHRARTRKLALDDNELHSLSSKIRQLSGIPTPSPSAPTHRIWRIQHSENFDSAEVINRLHMPTDLGDIYEMSPGHLFVLLAPRCDLMVRGESGKRGQFSDMVKEVFLAEITEKEPLGASWKLEFYDQSREHYLNFKKGIIVSLYALDLCVFNDDGRARFSLKSDLPRFLIPSWQKRFEVMKTLCAKKIREFSNLRPAPGKGKDISQLVTKSTNSSLVTGAIDEANETISYSLKRIKRLLDPRATAALNAYCRFLGRDAFDHSLEIPPKPPEDNAKH